MKPARWLESETDSHQVEALMAALRLQPPAARVLAARGFPDAIGARRFLRPSIDDMHSPLLLAGMGAAAARLCRAVLTKERILLYGDYDVDGTTSVIILKKAIELAGGQAEYYIPHRLKDGYGMKADVIERAAASGVSLVISVDTGIRAGDVVRRASALGIDAIITDHHLPEEELPPALAVLNPNRPDCSYPDKNLCGAGVAFKLVQALLVALGWPPERVRKYEESFLKMVALATVADVVPLLGENRVIVKHGLEGFRSLRNPGLRALMAVSGFADGDRPTAGQVAFRIAPRINAAGRMDTARDVIDLFLTNDAERARVLAAQLHDLNYERQQTESEIVAAVLEECERAPVSDEQAALVFCGEGWHRGVLGIVASRLVERFCRPVFVLSRDTGSAEAQGSGRSVAGFHLLDALDSARDVFTRYGGHRMAAGVALDAARVGEFRERFNAYAKARLDPEDFCARLEIDAPITLSEVNDQAVMEVLQMAPFGAGNPHPQFLARELEVAAEPSVIKDRHLRVRLRQNGRVILAKAWNFVGRASEFRAGARVDAVLSFEEDAFSASRGYPAWGVILKDVRQA